jgi:hypothetical protein
MARSTPHRFQRLARFAVALQALYFAASIAAAPVLHPYVCTGPCTSAALHARAAAGGAASACHACPGTHGKRGRCECTDDCCTMHAQFVAPPEVADDGPSVLHVARLLPDPPDTSRRARAARLLPYPNGPPAIA